MKKIMVPTDGSALSARAIPIASRLAAAQGASVVVVQVAVYPILRDMGAETYWDADVYQQVIDSIDQDAQLNLDSVAASIGKEGVPTETALLHGSPAAALLDYESLIRPDLVVMATHGRTGLLRFARGSIADAMVREGEAPVLLVQAFGPETTTIDEALVPLDGSLLAEQALPVVESLARKPLKSVRLIRAVEAPGDCPVAEAYLRGIAPRWLLRQHGLEVNVETLVGKPADIIRTASLTANILIMATHGRGGLDRLRHGSVAERSLRELQIPVLLVRAGRALPTSEPTAEVAARRG